MWARTAFLFLCVVLAANGFVPNSSMKCTSSTQVQASRRAFVESSAAAVFGAAMAGIASPAGADDVGDLSMPTEEEEKAAKVRWSPMFAFGLWCRQKVGNPFISTQAGTSGHPFHLNSANYKGKIDDALFAEVFLMFL